MLKRGLAMRWIWVAAMAMAVSCSVVAVWPTSASAPTTAAPFVAEQGSGSTSSPRELRGPAAVTRTELMPLRARFAVAIPAVPESWDRTLRRGWAALSALLFVVLAWSGLRLARDRRRWKRHQLQESEVLISNGFGPAIVGLTRPAIVVPPWVLALDAKAQSTILAHEDEHRRSRDPQLLLAALLVVVAMPWNVGLWFIWRRLNRAIELDCDERVLARGVPDAEYANVLLGAWQRAHGDSTWLPSPAFAERASGLGRRVEHLMRPAPRRWIMKAVLGTLVTATLAGAALFVPVPQLAQAVAATPAAMRTDPTFGLVVIDGVKRKDLNSANALLANRKLMIARGDSVALMQTVDAVDAVRLYGEDGRHGAVAMWTQRYIDGGGAVLPRSVVKERMAPRADATVTPAVMNGRIYDRLFRGIALTADKEAKARAVIAQENDAQLSLNGPYLAVWPKRIALTAQRDEQLRALVTSPADRAQFDARAEEGAPAPLKSVSAVADGEAFNYFNSLNVPARDRARALPGIEKALVAERDLYLRAPQDTEGRKAILAKRDADVRATLSTDALKIAFDKRQRSLRNLDK